MKLIPNICGKNAINLPSVCDELGRFVGLTDITIMQGDSFDPTEGVYAVDGNGHRIPYEVTPASINTCNVGDYTFIYATEEFIGDRVIKVLQVPSPTISFPSGSLACDAIVCDAVLDPNSAILGEPFDALYGVTAIDGHGNTVTVTCAEGSTVTFTESGSQELHYTATDPCGNVGTATRTITVLAGSFEGVEDTTVTQGTVFDPRDGVTAKSYNGTEIPFTITPNTYSPCDVGTQTFTYSAQGVESVERTVTVTAIANPTISGISETLVVGVGEEFDPLDGVTAVDGNGNTVAVTVVLEP